MSTCTGLTSEVADALAHSPLGHLRRLVVVENDAEVVITGTVSSYYLKQMAQETIRYAVGTRRILNHVEVRTYEAA